MMRAWTFLYAVLDVLVVPTGVAILLMDSLRVRQLMVLPEPVGPTSMTPWRTAMVSHNCLILSNISFDLKCPLVCNVSVIESFNLPISFYNCFVFGNKSLIMFSNKGMSCLRNLGKFMSYKALRTIELSSTSGSRLFNKPALLIVERTARRP